MEKIKLYHCGDPGAYDEYHPVYVKSIEYVPEILYIIAKNEAFTLSTQDIAKLLNIEVKGCIKGLNALKKINAITESNGRFKLNFQAYLEEDVLLLQEANKHLSRKLGEKIIELENKIVEKIKNLKHCDNTSIGILLYHIIACRTLDWQGLDYFAEKGILNISKIQPGNRDYLIIGYEENKKVREYSDKLFCCSNNTKSENIRFSSFGDDQGLRMKGMRGVLVSYQRNLIHGSKYKEVGQAYNALLKGFNDKLVKDLGELLLDIANKKLCYNQFKNEDKLMIDFLKVMEYIGFKDESSIITVKIPIFEVQDKVVLNEISEMVLLHISEEVEKAFRYIAENVLQLTSIRHMVDIKDMANEIWHQIFGEINNYLMEVGFIAKPTFIEGEGHYFKALYIDG